MDVFETVRKGFNEDVGIVRHGASTAWNATRREAEFVYDHPNEAARDAWHGVEKGAEWVYDKALGDDIATLRNPKASTADKVIAGISIASNFVGPEGKLIDKSLSILAKEALEHGGERLVADGVKMLEESLGKDAYRELALKGASLAKDITKGVEVAEKVIDRLNIARSAKEAIVHTLEDTKALVNDGMKAIQAPPGERAEAWKTFAKDLAKEGGDVVAIAGVVAKGRESFGFNRPSTAQLRNEATETLLEDASRAKSHGRIVIRGEHFDIDARDAKTLDRGALRKIEKMDATAQADGRRLVVYDPHITSEQEHELLASGVSVAKSKMDLNKLAVAARLPNGTGVELVNLDRKVRTNELFEAVGDRKDKNELRDTAGNLPAFVHSGPAEVGRKHESAKAWDGKAAVNGSISWARDGEVEQYCRGKWTRYEASELTGDRPIEGRQVTIRPDPAHPGHAMVIDPQQQERSQQIERQTVGR